MQKQFITLDDNSCLTIPMINGQLSRKLPKDEFINSVIAFTGMIFVMAEQDGLFKENLNNVLGTKDFKRFFTGEDG